MKNSVELKQERKAIFDQIEELNGVDNPDFDQIEELQKGVDQLEKRIDTQEKIETRKAENLAQVSKLAQVNAGSQAESNIPKDEMKVYQEFSIIKAIGQIRKNNTLEGAEAEAYAICEDEMVHPGVKLLGNIGIPQKLLRFGKKKQVTVIVEGPNIVEEVHGPKIPLLEITPAVLGAGSRLFSGQSADLHFPKGVTGAVVAWEGEVDPAAETTPTYGNIKLSPNRLAAYTDFSIQSNTQASFDLEADLRQRLASAASIEWDRVALLGSGAGNEPLGIVNQAGVTVIPTVANSIDWATALKYPADLAVANVPIDGSAGYMGPASVKSHLMGQPKDAGSGLFVMPDSGTVAGLPFHTDNNLQLDAGIGTNEQTMVFGRWSDNYMAQWNGTSILYDPYTQAVQGTVRLVLNLYLDNNVAHIESFNYSDDIIP